MWPILTGRTVWCLMTNPPLWVTYVMERMPDLYPEYMDTPYDHVVLIKHLAPEDHADFEQWIATLDTYHDVMHLALRSGSYVMEPVGDKSPEAVAEWFDNAFSRLYDREYEALRDELGLNDD